MTTSRTPTRRGHKPPTKFAPEVIAAFRRMRAARCTCPEIGWTTKDGYWKRPPPCAGCDAWWENHNKLHRALKLPPYQWPAYERPDAVCPYSSDSHAAEHWHRSRAQWPERFELYAALKAATGEAM
jgi:hypothetical protein